MEDEKILKEKSVNKIFLGIVIIFLVLLAPFVYFLANLLLGFWSFKNAENSLKNGDLKTASRNIFFLKGAVSRDKSFFEMSKPVFVLLNFEDKFEKGESLFSLTEVLVAGVEQGVLVATEGTQLLGTFLAGGEFDSARSLTEMQVELRGVLEKVSLSQGFLNDFTGREPLVGSFVWRLKKELPEWRLFLGQAQDGVGILRKILETEERSNYLVLFQNNMELRPTGGFIGSYGLLTLEQGKLLNFEVQDVYWADGQLRGHVEPPEKLKEFLGAASWYLRDSNWDPDFPTSAARGAWFLEKETGRAAKGVIAVDLVLAQRILGILGEINLVDYQEKVNAQNFFEKTQFHSEIGFFPGSTAKRDFLGAVSLAIFEELRRAPQKDLMQIIFSLFQSLAQKDILVYLPEENSGLLTKLGWDGALRQAQCKTEDAKCLGDYLMIVEANVGVNKANYFLTRNLELKTQINQDGSVEKKLTIFYENASPSETFPAGRYKNYLRIYIPEGATLQRCKIDNEETCRVDQVTEHQKQVFGFLLEVPAQEKRKVEISWGLPVNFLEGKYLFLIQKQPGTKNDGLALSLFYPPNLKVMPKTAGGLTGEGVLFYNTPLGNDLIFEIDFYKL